MRARPAANRASSPARFAARRTSGRRRLLCPRAACLSESAEPWPTAASSKVGARMRAAKSRGSAISSARSWSSGQPGANTTAVMSRRPRRRRPQLKLPERTLISMQTVIDSHKQPVQSPANFREIPYLLYTGLRFGECAARHHHVAHSWRVLVLLPSPGAAPRARRCTPFSPRRHSASTRAHARLLIGLRVPDED